MVEGYVFPFGVSTREADEIIRNAGFRYSRNVKSSHSFYLPHSPFPKCPTCVQYKKVLFSLLEQFIRIESDQYLLFYIWVHGYELDLDTSNLFMNV